METITTNRDAFLDMLGLQVKRPASDYIAPAVAIFGTGLVVGAALGLLFAPSSGYELRQDLARRIRREEDAYARLPDRPATSPAAQRTNVPVT